MAISNTNTVPASLIPEWQEKLEQLSQSGNFSDLVSEPFLGYKPAEFQEASKRILYIGKATAGNPSISELEHVYRFWSSPFWTLARDLADTASNVLSQPTSFAWSNVCKIGRTSTNPNQQLVDQQAPLAVLTLRAELTELPLDLAVFVCEGFADELVYKVFDLWDDRGGERDFVTHDFEGVEFWSRPAMEGFPPVLWVKHPQFKNKEMLRAWTEQAVALMR